MTRDEFIHQVKELEFKTWVLKNNGNQPMMSHVIDASGNIISTVSETKCSKFDFNGVTLNRNQCVMLMSVVAGYARTPLEER